MSKEIFDEMFETLLDEAVEIVESESDDISTDVKPVRFSEKFEKQMRDTFKKERRRIKRNKILRYSQRIAACFAAFIIVSGITVMSVSALRTRVFNFIFNHNDTNTEVKLNASDGNEEAEAYSGNIPNIIGYIPDEFEIDRQNISDNMIYLKYKNGDRYFTVTITEQNNTESIDTENAQTEEFYINGKQALYSENDNGRILVTYNENKIYTIKGNLDRDELVKIAQSLKNY